MNLYTGAVWYKAKKIALPYLNPFGRWSLLLSTDPSVGYTKAFVQPGSNLDRLLLTKPASTGNYTTLAFDSLNLLNSYLSEGTLSGNSQPKQMIYGYKVAEGTYPQIWTTEQLTQGDIYTCARPRKRPYSMMVNQFREVFPGEHKRILTELEPVSISSAGFSLTADFKVSSGWIMPTWEVEMTILQGLIMQAYKKDLLPESFTRSRYNRLTKIVTLGLSAGTPGEKQGAILAASRVMNSVKEKLLQCQST